MASKRRKVTSKSLYTDDDEYYSDYDYIPEESTLAVADTEWSSGATVSKRARERLDNLNKGQNGRGGAKTLESTGTSSELDDDDGSLLNFKDHSNMQLKPQHENRPIWVLPDGHIFLEAASLYYIQAYDFLVAIAEPVSRPEFVHEYKLTPYSLYAAVAVSIDTESIVRVLNRLSKTAVPASVENFIRECTVSYGKAKLVLKHNKHYIESPHPKVLQDLLKNPTVGPIQPPRAEHAAPEIVRAQQEPGPR
ncbi:unnamed protein product [Discosporangium mesarthrocarpum]